MNNIEDIVMGAMATAIIAVMLMLTIVMGVAVYQSFEPDTYNKKTINLNLGENNAENLFNQR